VSSLFTDSWQFQQRNIGERASAIANRPNLSDSSLPANLVSVPANVAPAGQQQQAAADGSQAAPSLDTDDIQLYLEGEWHVHCSTRK